MFCNQPRNNGNCTAAGDEFGEWNILRSLALPGLPVICCNVWVDNDEPLLLVGVRSLLLPLLPLSFPFCCWCCSPCGGELCCCDGCWGLGTVGGQAAAAVAPTVEFCPLFRTVLLQLFDADETLPIPSDILIPLTIDWVTELVFEEFDDGVAVGVEVVDIVDGDEDEDACEPVVLFALLGVVAAAAAEFPTFLVAFRIFLIAVAALTGD